MNWIQLNTIGQLAELELASNENPVLIFKHSTRCSTSYALFDRLQRNYKPGELKNTRTYFLDLITHRDISNAIALKFKVEHQSPQAIVIKDGKVIYSASHFNIDYQAIRQAAI